MSSNQKSNSQTTQKQTKKQDIAIGKFPRPRLEKVHKYLQGVYEEVQKTDLYKEDGSVYEDMQQTIYILNQVYTFLYNKTKSNLSKKDVEIFVDHLMRKVKGLKDLTQQIDE